MTREQKRQARSAASDAISMPKSRLIDVLRNMEEAGLPEAKKLGSILGKLEALQNKLASKA